ncbi:MAG: DNA-binding protein [Alphaproteobacteria bacterium]|nr:DNA-binding protein [Alphaproteobacteria bacterium]
MPDKKTIERAKKDKEQGKSASTQAGEFVREEIHKVRRGEHGARSPQQAIAIGLSQARRAGVDLPPPRKGQVKERTRRSAKRAYEAGQHMRKPARRPRISKAVTSVLKREPTASVSARKLSTQAKEAARRRSPAARSAAAHKAAQTKGKRGRSAAARKAAKTLVRHRRRKA